MPFRVKNLMVSVLPQVADTVLQQPIYQFPLTRCVPTTSPDVVPTWCNNNSGVLVACTRSIRNTQSQACQEIVIDFGDVVELTALKLQLDAQINVLNANLSLKTVADAEMMEAHLTEALTEVKATKEALRKASK